MIPRRIIGLTVVFYTPKKGERRKKNEQGEKEEAIRWVLAQGVSDLVWHGNGETDLELLQVLSWLLLVLPWLLLV